MDILVILSSLDPYGSERLKTDEKVELTEAQLLITDLPPQAALSYPIIIVFLICLEKEGTHKVLPFLAMICKRILVAID